MTAPVPAYADLTPAARRVLDAASTLFYDRGIHAVGVDTIADHAGVTKKTLYDRFGSKESLVVAYLQRRDARWREHLDNHLDATAATGTDRVLAVFDAATIWSDANSSKGCSAINAHAEYGQTLDGNPIQPEVVRQKRWMLELFVQLCGEAEIEDAETLARTMMLLYEGAIVTVGMGTFPHPFEQARRAAQALLGETSTPAR